MFDVPDHPDIRRMESRGPEHFFPLRCPACGKENPDAILRVDGDVVGCTSCVEFIDPIDYWEEVADASQVNGVLHK